MDEMQLPTLEDAWFSELDALIADGQIRLTSHQLNAAQHHKY